MKKGLSLLLVCFLATVSLHADAALGSVTSFSGTVTIDAFGKGAFIPAIKGDALYGATVLRVGANARATVSLQGATRDIPPGSEVKVADLLSSSSRKAGLGWFGAVGKLMRSFADAAPKKEELVLGSRAAEAASSTEMDWDVEETDAATLISEALPMIDQGRYAAALDKLAGAEDPADKSVAWDLSFWRGFSYFQLEDYGDAVKALSAASHVAKTAGAAPGTPENRATLLFQLGSSYFLLGQEKDCIPQLDAYLAGYGGGHYAPYASLILAKALRTTGDAGRSKSVAQAALAKYKGSDVEGELASLAQ